MPERYEDSIFKAPVATPRDVKVTADTSITSNVDDVDTGEVAWHEIIDAEPDQQYLSSTKWQKIFRGTFFQMVCLGLLSFSGPAMSDAIDQLGGGGLATPYTANAANAAQYALACGMTLFGGPLINKIGIKWSCVIAALWFPFQGSSYYINSKYGTQVSQTAVLVPYIPC